MGLKSNTKLLRRVEILSYFLVNSSYIINAINAKKSGLSASATAQEIAAYITANWTGGSSSGNITYVRHYHESNCYGTCNGSVRPSRWVDSVNYSWQAYQCQKCGREFHQYESDYETAKNGSCPVRVTTCGMSDGQILSATITY